MLTDLQLLNFRGFEKHTLELRPLTVIVGRNNAGKSTIVEALRLVSVVANRFGYLNFRDPPDWLELSRAYRGVSPDLSLMGFEFSTAFHRYADPPATIVARFDDRVVIRIYVGSENQIHAVVLDPKGQPITDKGRARALKLRRVAILPQIGPLVHDEEILSEEYVQRTVDTSLSSPHFRNQLRVAGSAYTRFGEMVQQSWPGVRVRELRRTRATVGAKGVEGKSRLSLLVQNDDYVAEAANMGHGLQMWLQIIWFLAKANAEATVILDEPDVYMHPDLQRRLLRLVSRRHRQVIIATHSTEIMADVSPEDILVVERTRTKSGFAPSLPAVQKVIEKLGGVHNLHLSRLWSAKRFLIVEGDDLDILGPLHAALFPETSSPVQAIPSGGVGGWGGWERAIGAASAMRNAFGAEIAVYCILDSDFNSSKTIYRRYERGEKERINLHVWARKEIENYLLVPDAIQRVIAQRVSNDVSAPSAADVVKSIEQIVESLRGETLAALTDALFADAKASGPGTATTVAVNILDCAWQNLETRWAIVSGKRALSALSEWSQRNYGVSFSVGSIARALSYDEIASEVCQVLSAIERCEPVTIEIRSRSTNLTG